MHRPVQVECSVSGTGIEFERSLHMNCNTIYYNDYIYPVELLTRFVLEALVSFLRFFFFLVSRSTHGIRDYTISPNSVRTSIKSFT